MMSKTVAIYGATAFSAGPAIEYLVNHPDASQFNLILAGRNQDKLAKVHSKLCKGKDVETVALELSDEQGVKDLVEKADVVMNFAGPYAKHNAEAIIRACAESGKHYVDLTGEGHWVGNKIIPRYDYLASTTGACIVPSCGFDSVPSDLTVYSALRTLQHSRPELSITKSQSFFEMAGTMSGGTIATIYTMVDIPASERRTDEWQMVTPYRMPSSAPSTVYRAVVDGVEKIGSFFFMYPYNRLIVRRSWHLSRMETSLFPKHGDQGGEGGRYPLRNKGKGRASGASSSPASKQEPVHGDNLHYEEAIQMPNKYMAFLVSFSTFSFFAMFFLSSLFRWGINKVIPQPGEGASREKLEKGWYKIENVSETTDPNIQVITRVKGKGDPGYLNTCYMLAESALALVLPPPEGTSLPPLASLGGVLTPSTAMGQVLVERLRKSGNVIIDSEVVEKGRGSKKAN